MNLYLCQCTPLLARIRPNVRQALQARLNILGYALTALPVPFTAKTRKRRGAC